MTAITLPDVPHQPVVSLSCVDVPLSKNTRWNGKRDEAPEIHVVRAPQVDQIGQVVPDLHELRIELLRACPLRCRHCSAFAAPAHPLQLAPVRVSGLLEEFAELGGRRVTFTGGEPLTYEALPSLLEASHRRGLSTRLFTSGVTGLTLDGARPAMNPNLFERIASSTDVIVFSVYSADAATHDAMTQVTGSFELTCAAIGHANMLGMLCHVHFVPTQANYRQLPAVVALAAALGVDQVSLLRFVPHGRGRARQQQLALDEVAHQWLRQEIVRLQTAYPTVKVKVGSAYNFLGVGDEAPCTAAVDQLVILADGSILPCSAFAEFTDDAQPRSHDPYGNITQYSLATVWRHSTFVQGVRAAVRATPQCAGCLAQKALASGRIDPAAPDFLADAYRATQRGAGDPRTLPQSADERWQEGTM